MRHNITRLLSKAGTSWDCVWGYYQNKRYKRTTAKRIRQKLAKPEPAEPIGVAGDDLVTCSRCGGTHEAMMAGERDFGDGCASFVGHGLVIGSFGSRLYDMRTFTIVSPVGEIGAVLCDSCVTLLAFQGALSLDAYEPRFGDLAAK